MRSISYVYVVILLVALSPLLAQDPPASGNQAHTAKSGAKDSPAAEVAPQDSARAQRRAQLLQMQQQQIDGLRKQLEQMRGMIYMLRTEGQRVKSVDVRDNLQTNADLWQTMLEAMQKNLDVMQEMQRAMAEP